jgi:general secretion pathway protein M
LLGIYALVWDPYVQGVTRLEQEVAEQRALLSWMENAAREVKALRGSGMAARPGGQSLLTLVDSTARAQGLENALQRVQPEGQNTVRVWLEKASFDDTLRWLDRLTGQQGLRVTGLVVEPLQEAGRVNARITLEGGA